MHVYPRLAPLAQDLISAPASQTGASILRGVGRAISHVFKSRWLTDWSSGLHIFDRLVSCCIRHPGDANSEQRLFEASVTVCLCKQHIAQYCGDSDKRIRVSKPRRAKE